MALRRKSLQSPSLFNIPPEAEETFNVYDKQALEIGQSVGGDNRSYFDQMHEIMTKSGHNLVGFESSEADMVNQTLGGMSPSRRLGYGQGTRAHYQNPETGSVRSVINDDLDTDHAVNWMDKEGWEQHQARHAKAARDMGYDLPSLPALNPDGTVARPHHAEAAVGNSPGVSSASSSASSVVDSPPPAPDPVPAPIETKTLEEKKAEVLGQRAKQPQRVPQQHNTWQRTVRDYLADVAKPPEPSADPTKLRAKGGKGFIPTPVRQALTGMGYEIPEPEMPGTPAQGDNPASPAYHSRKQVEEMYGMAEHLAGRDLENEARLRYFNDQRSAGNAPAAPAKLAQGAEKVAQAASSGAPIPQPVSVEEYLSAHNKMINDPSPENKATMERPEYMQTRANEGAAIDKSLMEQAKAATPAGAKIPQAADAPAQAAQKLASTESVPTTSAPASSAAQAADDGPGKFDMGAVPEDRIPKRPKPGELGSQEYVDKQQAEIEERQRAQAKKKYEQLANSDNPRHRAMAEKLKARAEGGNVIKDGKAAGTLAEQPGSTVPKISDSPAEAAQKVANTASVPIETGAAAARKSSLPEGANNLGTTSTPGSNQAGPTTGAQAARSAANMSPPAFGHQGGEDGPGTTRGQAARGARGVDPNLDRSVDRVFGEATNGVANNGAKVAPGAAVRKRRGAGKTGGATGAAAFPSSPAAGAGPVGGANAPAGSPGAAPLSPSAAYQAQVEEAKQARAAKAARAGGGSGAAAAGKATKGSRTNGMLRGMAYNSSLVDRELDLTTRGFVAGIGSIANDLGLNRRVTAYGADGKPSSYMDTFFGTTIRGGTGYAHPLMDDAGRVTWTTAKTVQAATAGWGKHIEDSFQSSTGIMKTMTGIRRSLYNGLGGGSDGFINKMLTKLGGAGTLVAPVLMGATAIADFRQGYKKGGVFGGIAGAGKGIVAGWIMNKVVAAALLNPVTTLIAGGAIAAAAYATYKIFDVRNQGNNYLRQRQMQGPSWKSGPSAGMSSSMGNTIRQRSIHAMENSRFNAMRSMGNESYMITAPKSRYANSTSIHSTAPMLSY